MVNDHDAKLRQCAEEIANCLIGLPGTQEIGEIAMTLRKHGAFPPPPEALAAELAAIKAAVGDVLKMLERERPLVASAAASLRAALRLDKETT